MGAWIETQMVQNIKGLKFVAPYMGAWIETKDGIKLVIKSIRRTLHGCVD